MGQFAGNALDVQVLWSSRHSWPAGQEYNGPCFAYALWLMVEGGAVVHSDGETWQVEQGDVFLWPKDRPRSVVTTRGATWLSLGMGVTALGQVDLMSLLTLPSVRSLKPDEYDQLFPWLKELVDIRDKLSHETPENQRVADYFESAESLSVRSTYDQWMSQIVDKRPSYYDVMEEGLARTVFGWVWSLWGPKELERAIHAESPLWLQKVLLTIRQHPEISVQELADHSGFSLAQFRRLFHQEMGLAPREYLQKQRLNVARHLIENTDLPIASIASHVGFSSVPHFIQLWKQTNGASPLQHRFTVKDSRV